MNLVLNSAMFPLSMLIFTCPESYRAEARNSSAGKVDSVFRVFASEADPRSHSAQQDGTDASANETEQYRYRRNFPGVTWGLTVCKHVRGQRLLPPATLRNSRHERAHHSYRREALRGGHGGS